MTANHEPTGTTAETTGETGAERIEREAEAAGERPRRNSGIAGAADSASRAWGVIVLAVGLWFFADVTLGLAMPSIAWRELWLVALILIGLFVVVRGLARRT